MRCSVVSCISLAASLSVLLSQQAPPKAKVSGIVVSAAGDPLRKAEVMLTRMDQGGARNSAVTTDAEGRFLFPAVEPGRYNVIAQKAGYINSSLAEARTRRNNILNLSDGQEVTGLTLKLFPQGVITGKVMDEDGDPIQHVSVQVANFRTVRGKRQLVPRGSSITNDIGEYRIANLLPGKLLVYATRPGGFQSYDAAAPVEEGYPITFYPNAMEPAQATMLECTPGNELHGIDFRLRKVRTFHVRGQITDYAPSEKAGPHFAVYVTRTGSGFGLSGPGGAQVAANGSFDVGGLVPGSYTLVAMRMVQGYSVTSSLPIELGNRNVEGISITLGDGINLKGTLKFESDQPPDPTKIRVVLEPVDNFGMGAANPQAAKADATFAILGASPTRYRVSAYGLPLNNYVKSVKVGQQEVSDTGLDLSGGAPGDLEVTISDKAATVSGVVMDDKQQQRNPGALILLLADGARRGQFRFNRTTTAGQDGSFVLSGVVPGEYLLLAVESMEDGAWEEPEFLQRFESKCVKLKLKEGAAENVQLTLLVPERTTP